MGHTTGKNSHTTPVLGVEGQFWHIRVLMFGIFFNDNNNKTTCLVILCSGEGEVLTIRELPDKLFYYYYH
jgi:hypothetical protein